MTKTLAKHGNSLALVIDKPILELLRIDDKTQLNVQTDGTGSMGIRDLGRLRSALAMPRGGFGGQVLPEFPH
jgi:antitoxin component of MazEF toxin-antitoxin module